MRIVLNTKPAVYSARAGIGNYVHNLYRQLKGFDDLDVIGTVEPGAMLSRLAGVSALLRRFLGPSYTKLAATFGDRLIRNASRHGESVRADLYHETNFEEPPHDTPFVANLYDLSFLRHPELLPSDVVQRHVHGLRWVERAERVIVNTEFTRDEARELLGMPAEKIDVIPLAPTVDPGTALHKSSRRDQKTANELTSRPYLLYVGTVEPRKGLITLIDAFQSLARVCPEHRLVIAGKKGWNYDAILARPEQLGISDRVVFAGYVNDYVLGSLYRAAEIFVYPSVYEGFGIPPLDAMAWARPVVVSEIPSLQEVTGGAAVTFPVGDRDALAGELVSLATSAERRRIFAERARERSGLFSWDRVARETVATYRRALSRV